jgi:hypothetical protein
MQQPPPLLDGGAFSLPLPAAVLPMLSKVTKQQAVAELQQYVLV